MQKKVSLMTEHNEGDNQDTLILRMFDHMFFWQRLLMKIERLSEK